MLVKIRTVDGKGLNTYFFELVLGPSLPCVPSVQQQWLELLLGFLRADRTQSQKILRNLARWSKSLGFEHTRRQTRNEFVKKGDVPGTINASFRFIAHV